MISACRRLQWAPRTKLSLCATCAWSPGGSLAPLLAVMMSGGGGAELMDWSHIFSEENKRRTTNVLATDRENSSFSFSSADRVAAVLVPFCFDAQGRPGLLCNLRSEHLNSHKGEISFPGGTREDQDNNDLVITALRETHEELGIGRDEVEVWTMCRAFPTVSTKMCVVPVVGFIKSGPVNADTLDINPEEVDHAFVLPLEHLCNPKHWGEMEPPRRLGAASISIPTYENLHEISDGLRGVHLWGLTAFITHLVLAAFIPNHYTRKVQYLSLMPRKRKKSGSSDRNSEKSNNSNNFDKAKNPPNSKL